MENTTQSPVEESLEILKKLAVEHQVSEEIVENMAHLMQEYPDLSIWGSKPELTGKLETIMEAHFRKNL